MYMHPHLINNADAYTARYLADIDRQEASEHAAESLELVVINDIQQGDPQTCSRFAEYCAENLNAEVTLALCLARINRDARLQQQAIAELNAEVDKSQAAFVVVEAARRIAVLQQQAEAKAMADLELDHV